MFGGFRRGFSWRVALVLVALGSAAPAWQVLPASPLLIGRDATGEQALSLADLRAMPWTTVATRNPYNDRITVYRGPLMRDVLARLGLAEAENVSLLAANDYSVDVPTGDFRRWNVIAAMEADGEALSARETGPLWVIYPLTGHPELARSVYAQRLIWQLVRIEAL